MSLNNDIISKIISQADVSIDTYLAFKSIGAVPKKLKIEEKIKEKLDNLCNKRIKHWKKDSELTFPYCCALYDISVDLDLKIKLKIRENGSIKLYFTQNTIEHIIEDIEFDESNLIFKKNGNLKYSFAILFSNITKQTTKILRREYYHIHDGSPSEGFYDSDDDDF